MQVREMVVAGACALIVGGVLGTASAPAQLLPGSGSARTTTTSSLPAPPVVAPPAATDAMTAEGGDASRRAWVAGDDFTPPFGVRWRATIGDDPGVPLIAGGRVFGHAIDPDLFGPAVAAYDAKTGEELWNLPITADAKDLSLAYAPGHLVVLDGSHRLHSLSPATGYEDWRADTKAGTGSSPVIAGSSIVVQGDDVVEAYKLGSGDPLWSRAIAGGTHGAPAVVGDRIYVATGCALVALDARDGHPLWTVPSTCSGGSDGGRAVAFGSLVTSADGGDGKLHDADTGAAATATNPLPLAVTDDTAFARGPGGGSLLAVDLATATSAWTTKTTTAPASLLALGGDLLTTGDGAVALYDGQTGKARWHAQLRRQGGAGKDAAGDAAPGAGGGLIVVPYGRQLVALSPVATAPADPVIMTASRRRDRLAGAKLPLTIDTGRQFVRRVVVEGDEAPIGRGGYRPIKTVTVDSADGRLRLDPTALSNVRLRVRPLDGGVPSKTATYFVYPKLTFKISRSGGKVVVPISARGRGVGGLTVAMFVIRPDSRSGKRLAQQTLDTTGPADGSATLRFAPLKHVTKADYLVACVVGADRHGLGRRDFLALHCAQSSFRY